MRIDSPLYTSITEMNVSERNHVFETKFEVELLVSKDFPFIINEDLSINIRFHIKGTTMDRVILRYLGTTIDKAITLPWYNHL